MITEFTDSTPSQNHDGSKEADIIYKSIDEEMKHTDKQYFQEYNSNLSGIFHYLVGFIYNLLSQILAKYFIICFDLYINLIAYTFDWSPRLICNRVS